DCLGSVSDPDEDYCRGCGEPLHVDCGTVINDEPLCAKCFAALRKAAIVSLRNDPSVGDVFQEAA
ncbi:MAG: hypothetical protein ACJ73N_00600, partial [Bryobacteraceae bacterium]